MRFDQRSRHRQRCYDERAHLVHNNPASVTIQTRFPELESSFGMAEAANKPYRSVIGANRRGYVGRRLPPPTLTDLDAPRGKAERTDPSDMRR